VPIALIVAVFVKVGQPAFDLFPTATGRIFYGNENFT
jgi:hypothetical protein